jgi:hypothetical protein
MQACMAGRILVCMAERILVGMAERILVGRAEGMDGMVPVAGTQVCMAQAAGILVCKPEAGKLVDMAARILVDMPARLRMNDSSHDCRNIPPIGALSCTEEATRR